MMSCPAPEPDEHVHPHRHEALEPVRHGRDLHPQQVLGDRRGQLVRSLQGGLRLAEEHRAVDLEVVVVRPVQRVEVHPAPAGPELLVGLDRGVVGRHDARIVAAQHVQMRRHVPQVARVRHQVAEQVPGAEGGFRGGRHLHQVDVHVQDAGVRLPAGAGQGPLEHLPGLDRGRPGGRLAGRLVPQRPRREVHQRVGQQRRHVEVVRVRPVHVTHGVGVAGFHGPQSAAGAADGYRAARAPPARARPAGSPAAAAAPAAACAAVNARDTAVASSA